MIAWAVNDHRFNFFAVYAKKFLYFWVIETPFLASVVLVKHFNWNHIDLKR